MSRCIAARSRGICAPITSRAASGLEHVLGEDADRAGGAALAHADEDDAVAGRHDVAALEPRQAPVVVGAAEPDREAGVAEARMEAVDRLDVQRLELARRPEHRVERDAAVDPGARVAREELVRQRRQHEVGRLQRVSDRRARSRRAARCTVTPPVSCVASSSAGISAIQCDQRARRTSPSPPRAGAAGTSSHSRASASSSVSASRSWNEQHLDAALAHQVDERVVLLPGAPHPDHVVEEQLVAVRRREPLVREVGPVHHDRSERPDLRVARRVAVSVSVLMSRSPSRLLRGSRLR